MDQLVPDRFLLHSGYKFGTETLTLWSPKSLGQALRADSGSLSHTVHILLNLCTGPRYAPKVFTLEPEQLRSGRSEKLSGMV